MRFRSRTARRTLLVALVGSVVVPLPRLIPTIADATSVIIQEGDVQREDLYALGSSVLVEGIVEGDLIVATGTLKISGRVEGDVLGVVYTRAEITGEVTGSVRLAARRVVVDGIVRDDLAVASTSVTVNGEVGRDVIIAGGTLRIDGVVGRDIRGQIRSVNVDGTVRRDLEISVGDLEVGPTAVLDGDVEYHSSSDADISPEAALAGQAVRSQAGSPLWQRALRRAVSIISLFAFLFTGLALMWLFRRSSHHAVETLRSRPWPSLAVGLGALLLMPVAVVLLAVTLVGLPVALLVLAAWLTALFVGAVPALSAAGSRALRGRGGMVGGFVAAALVWRAAMWVLPIGGMLLWLIVTMWGAGAWVLGAWQARQGWHLAAEELPPPEPEETPEGWEPPLPPIEDAAEPVPDPDL